MTSVDVCETYESIQGESSYAGRPCFFIRLAGCNLRCRYCDTPQAYGPGRPVAVTALVEQVRASSVPLAEITGGEPLLQEGFPRLAESLSDVPGKTVLVETNGSCDISSVPEGVVTIMDMKCPGSGQSQAMDMRNLERLRAVDEVKFVIGDRTDYEWARELVVRHGLADRCRAVFFNPVFARDAGGNLARWIIGDALNVRLQVQLHKVVNMD
jgi:7-carboxy-7-deazaguanine synthase